VSAAAERPALADSPHASSPRGLPDADAGLALIKPALRSAPAYALGRPPHRRKLDQNEAPWDFPEALKGEVLARVGAGAWQRYPGSAPRELCARLAARYGWRPDGVLVGNGSNELIEATLASIVGDGDVVVAPEPTYSLYQRITGLLGARYAGVGSGLDHAYDVDALVAAARRERARVVVLVSPNNPTGAAVPQDAVLRILSATDALVLVDEAYQDFGGPTAVPLLARSSRVVVLKTLSKALGLAGLRLGVALAHPAMAREIAKAQPPYGPNLATLAAAEVALEHADLLAERTRRVVETRDLAEARLQLLPGLTIFPSAANFFLIRCHALPAREVHRRLLEEDGILVRDVSGTPGLAGCLRISVGTPEDMDAAIAALARILGGRVA
jgi:histidinol-phosphate aminotransferase